MMNNRVKIPETAEEQIQETLDKLGYDIPNDLKICIIEDLQEFAKMHVEAAIKECISSAPSGSSTDTVSYEDVVEALQDCYPLTNIK